MRHRNATRDGRTTLIYTSSTVRMLNEATQYELGPGYAQHMWMSITTWVLVWNQATLLHKKRRVSI